MGLRDFGLKPLVERPEDALLVDEAVAAGKSQLGLGFKSGSLNNDANYLAAEEVSARASGDVRRADQLRAQIGGLQRRAQVYAPSVQNVEDVNLGNFGSYAGGMIGQGAASMTDPLLAAAAARAATSVPGIPRAMGRVATLAAPFMVGQRQATGSVYNRMVEDPETMAGRTPQDLERTANLSGAISGAMDAVLPAALATRTLGGALTAARGARPGAAVSLSRDLSGEAVTELGQSGTELATLGLLNPNRDTSGDQSELLNAAVGGAVGAGPFSGGSIAVGSALQAGVDGSARVREQLGRGADAAGEMLGPVGRAGAAVGKKLFGRAKEKVSGIDLDTGKEIVDGLRDATAKGVSRTKQSVEDRELFRPMTELPEGMTADSPEFGKIVEARDNKRAARFAELLAERGDDPQAQAALTAMQNAPNPAQRAEAIDAAGEFLENASTLTRVARAAGRAATRTAQIAKKTGKAVSGLAGDLAAGVNEGRKLNAQGAGFETLPFEDWVKGRDEMRAGLRDTQLPRQPNAGDAAGAQFDAQSESFKRAASFANLSASYMEDMAARRWQNRLNAAPLARELGYELSTLDAGFEYRAPGQGAVRAVAGAGKGKFAKRGGAGRAAADPNAIPTARLNRLASKLNDLYGDQAGEVLGNVRAILERQGKPLTKLDYITKELEQQQTDPRGTLRRQAQERDELGNDLVSLIPPETEQKLMGQGVNLRTDAGRDELVRLLQGFINGDYEGQYDEDSGNTKVSKAQKSLPLSDAPRSSAGSAMRRKLDSIFGAETVDAMLERVEPEQFARPELLEDSLEQTGEESELDDSDMTGSDQNRVKASTFEENMAQRALNRSSTGVQYVFKNNATRLRTKADDQILDDKTEFFDKDEMTKSVAGVEPRNKLKLALESAADKAGPEYDAKAQSVGEFAKELGMSDIEVAVAVGVDRQLLSRAIDTDDQSVGAKAARRQVREAVDDAKKNKFVVRVERAAPRDSVSIDTIEVKRLIAAGKRAISGAKYDADKEKPRSEAERRAELDRRNVLFFGSKNDLSDEGNAPILAGNLATWGMQRRSEQGNEKNVGSDQEFYDGLIEGITALMTTEFAGRGMPFRYNAKGEREFFGDESFPNGIPPSLKLRTGTYKDLAEQLETERQDRATEEFRAQNAKRKSIERRLIKRGVPFSELDDEVDYVLEQQQQAKLGSEQQRELGDEITDEDRDGVKINTALDSEVESFAAYREQLARGASAQGAPDRDRSPPPAPPAPAPYSGRVARAKSALKDLPDAEVFAQAKKVLDSEQAGVIPTRTPKQEAVVREAYERAGAARAARGSQAMAPAREPLMRPLTQEERDAPSEELPSRAGPALRRALRQQIDRAAPEVAGEAPGKSQSALAGARKPYNGAEIRKLNAQSAELHSILGRPGFPATHDSPIRHEGKFDWRAHQGKGEGFAAFGAGTYLSTADGVHKSYKEQFTAVTSRGTKTSMQAELENMRQQQAWVEHLANPTSWERYSFVGEDPYDDTTGYGYRLKDDRSGENGVFTQDGERWYAPYAEPGDESFDTFADALRLTYGGDAIKIAQNIKKLEAQIAAAVDPTFVNSPTYQVSVDIPADQLLDWNKDYDKQSDFVKKALDRAEENVPLIFKGDLSGAGMYRAIAKQLGKVIPGQNQGRPGGARDTMRPDQAAASDYLQSLGILGHKYNASGGRNDAFPNYVIYDDSKITTNYVYFNKQGSNERLNPNRVASQQEMDDAAAYVKRVLGGRIKTVFEDITFTLPDGRKVKISGEYIDADKVIKLSTTAGPGVLNVAYHESMHALWSDLGKQPEVRTMLNNVVSNPAILNRINALLAKSPMAQAQLGSAEERVAYAYQFWAAGMLDVGKNATTVFQKVKAALRRVLNMVRDEDRALQIFQMFKAGEFADPSAAGIALNDIMSRGTWTKGARKTFDRQLQYLMKATFPSHTVMLMSESDTAKALGRKFFSAPGDEKGGTDGEGYLNATRRVTAQYLNLVAQVLDGMNEKDLASVEKYLQSETELSDIPFQPHREAVNRVRKLMRRFRTYAKEAGVDMGDRGEKYYPRVWDVQKLYDKKTEFKGLLLSKYSSVLDLVLEEHKKKRQLRPDRLRKDERNHAPEMNNREDVAQYLWERLVDRGGVDEHIDAMRGDVRDLDIDKIDVKREDGVLTPFFSATNKRDFAWLDNKDVEAYMEKDIVGRMTRYFRQGVKSAEYTRRFGTGSGKDNDLAVALGYEEFVPGAGYQWVKGTVEVELEAAAAAAGAKDQKEWVARRMAAIGQATGAMEGSLGKDINPTWRKATSWLMVYQNLRLLPLALFASVVDPLGMVARGATLDEAYKGFLRGMREVVKTWKSSLSGETSRGALDETEKLAELIGVVDSQHYLDSLGAAYASEYLDEGARKVNNWLFTANGMEAWNRSMRVSATASAIGFIELHAKNADPTHSARWIKELGLDQATLPMKDGKLATTVQDLAKARGLDLSVPAQRQQAEAEIGAVHVAITRWVEGAVLTPNAAQRPGWASDPHWAFIFHLKQFTYSFHQTILRRAVRELNYGNLGPISAFLWYVPVMISADIVKGLIQGGGELPDYMKAYDVGDWLMHGIQRAGLLGIGQIGVDTEQDMFSVLGPSVEQITDAIADPLDKTIVKSLPANPLYKDALL